MKLKTCKYKGVEFQFTDMPTTFGNRILKYNYPASDKQAIEVQGKTPRSFVINAIIPHTDYYQHKAELMSVLEDGKSGVLHHPTFGIVHNVINGECSITEKLSEVGRAEVSIPFEIDDATGSPIKLFDTFADVERSVENTDISLQDAIIEKFGLSGIATNITDAFDLANDIVNDVKSVTNLAIDAKLAIESPALFADVLGGVFKDAYELYESADLAFDAMERLFDFGDDAPIIMPTTFSRIERKNNQDILIGSAKTWALMYAYLSAARIEYSTETHLENVLESLENQYTNIRDNFDIGNETMENLDIARVSTSKYIDQKTVTVPKIFTINTPIVPLSVLLYKYYGNTDLFDTIVELNDIGHNAFVEGEVKLVSV